MSTLRDRIGELMRETELSVGEIAEAAKVSSSAVSQWVNGQTQSIRIEAAILLERKTSYSALWLSKGVGIKKLERDAERPMDLAAALSVLASAITRAAEGPTKTGAIQMLKTFVDAPTENADLAPLITRRLANDNGAASELRSA